MASLTLIFTRSVDGLVGCEVPTDLVKISVKEAMHMGFYYTDIPGIAVRNRIAYEVRSDLEFVDSEMESVFIEVEKFGTSSSLVIGVIYRMPDSPVEIFKYHSKGEKICYFLGDLNLDLLRREEHRPTFAFLEILYSYNVYQLISKSTRVTANSATLIGHI